MLYFYNIGIKDLLYNKKYLINECVYSEEIRNGIIIDIYTYKCHNAIYIKNENSLLFWKKNDLLFTTTYNVELYKLLTIIPLMEQRIINKILQKIIGDSSFTY